MLYIRWADYKPGQGQLNQRDHPRSKRKTSSQFVLDHPSDNDVRKGISARSLGTHSNVTAQYADKDLSGDWSPSRRMRHNHSEKRQTEFCGCRLSRFSFGRTKMQETPPCRNSRCSNSPIRYSCDLITFGLGPAILLSRSWLKV